MVQLLGLQEPWRRQLCGDTDCLHHRSYGPIRVFFRASGSWQSEGLFGQSFSIAPPIQALRGLPCLVSFSVVQHIRHIEEAPLAGVLLCRSAHQSLKGAPWVGSCSVVQCVRHLMGQPLYCSVADAGVWEERGYGDGSTPHMTQQYRLASMASWLSSTGISHHSLLFHIPLIHLSTANSSPHPGIAQQSINSSS